MDGALDGSLVHEADDALPALLLDEGRTGRDAVVAHEVSRLQAREDLLGEVLDLDLIVVDLPAVVRVGDGAVKMSVRQPSEHQSCQDACPTGVHIQERLLDGRDGQRRLEQRIRRAQGRPALEVVGGIILDDGGEGSSLVLGNVELELGHRLGSLEGEVEGQGPESGGGDHGDLRDWCGRMGREKRREGVSGGGRSRGPDE
jgi:hypothetical protein